MLGSMGAIGEKIGIQMERVSEAFIWMVGPIGPYSFPSYPQPGAGSEFWDCVISVHSYVVVRIIVTIADTDCSW